jgi:hypothetical protein
MNGGDGLSGALPRRDSRQFEVRMAQEQADQFLA